MPTCAFGRHAPPLCAAATYALSVLVLMPMRILAGQIGPLANLRSSSGCAVLLRSDSPVITLHLDRLRHHQFAPVGIDIEVIQAMESSILLFG